MPVSEPGSAGCGIRRLRGQFVGTGPHTFSEMLQVRFNQPRNLPLALALFLPIILPADLTPTECGKRKGQEEEKTIKADNLAKRERASLFGYRFSVATDAVATVALQVQEALREPDDGHAPPADSEVSPAQNEESALSSPVTPSGRQQKDKIQILTEPLLMRARN